MPAITAGFAVVRSNSNSKRSAAPRFMRWRKNCAAPGNPITQASHVEKSELSRNRSAGAHQNLGFRNRHRGHGARRDAVAGAGLEEMTGLARDAIAKVLAGIG